MNLIRKKIFVFLGLACCIVISLVALFNLIDESIKAQRQESYNLEVINNLGVPIYESRFNSPEVTIIVHDLTVFVEKFSEVNATKIFQVGTSFVVVDSDFVYAWEYNPTVYANHSGIVVIIFLSGAGCAILVWCLYIIEPPTHHPFGSYGSVA